MTISSNKKVIRLSKLFLYEGLFCSIIFALFWYICVRSVGMGVLYVHIVCGFLFLVSLSLLISYLVYRITYDEEEFTVRNAIGIKHTYRYDQVTGIEIEKGKQAKLVIGKKKYVIDYLHTGARVMLGKALTGDGWELQNYAWQSLKRRYGDDYKKYIKYIQTPEYTSKLYDLIDTHQKE